MESNIAENLAQFHKGIEKETMNNLINKNEL